MKKEDYQGSFFQLIYNNQLLMKFLSFILIFDCVLGFANRHDTTKLLKVDLLLNGNIIWIIMICFLIRSFMLNFVREIIHFIVLQIKPSLTDIDFVKFYFSFAKIDYLKTSCSCYEAEEIARLTDNTALHTSVLKAKNRLEKLLSNRKEFFLIGIFFIIDYFFVDSTLREFLQKYFNFPLSNFIACIVPLALIISTYSVPDYIFYPFQKEDIDRIRKNHIDQEEIRKMEIDKLKLELESNKKSK